VEEPADRPKGMAVKVNLRSEMGRFGLMVRVGGKDLQRLQLPPQRPLSPGRLGPQEVGLRAEGGRLRGRFGTQHVALGLQRFFLDRSLILNA